jgi:hypothetical protein
MHNLDIVQSINEFNDACDDAVKVYCHGKELQGIVLKAPEGDINTTAMNVLNQAIEGLVERSGVHYSTLAMESAGTRTELKRVSVEGIGSFALEIWKKIKQAFFYLVKKIKEFFTDNERKAVIIKENIDKAKKEFSDIQKEAIKKDVEDKELSIVIENPSPFILHKSYFKNGGKEVTVNFHDLVENLANYCMKSREHHLIEYVREFKEDVMGLLDKIDPASINVDVINEIYAILNNYVSEKKLTGEQVSNLRKFKGLETVEEFDSDYGNKRYIMKFGINKIGDGNGAEQLTTEQAISKAYRANEIMKMTITGVEVLDMKHLMNALTDNYTELGNYIKISREINSLNVAVIDMIREMDDKIASSMDTDHVVTLSLINKCINAVSRLFTVIENDVMSVMKEHTGLYMLFNEKFRSELL